MLDKFDRPNVSSNVILQLGLLVCMNKSVYVLLLILPILTSACVHVLVRLTVWD